MAAPLNPSSVPVSETQCREGHFIFEPGPAGNTLQILIFLHLDTSNSNGLPRDTRNNITHWVFEGELAVKLRDKDTEVWTSANWNTKQYQVTLERGSHSWIYYPLTPWFCWDSVSCTSDCTTPESEPATTGLSAGLWSTASNVKSSALAYRLFSTRSQTFHFHQL